MTNFTDTDQLEELLENVAAITFEWRDDNDAWDDFYMSQADNLGGFIGIQGEAIRAAKAFTIESAQHVPGETYYWVEAIAEFAGNVMDYYVAGTVPTTEDLHRLATGAIEKCPV